MERQAVVAHPAGFTSATSSLPPQVLKAQSDLIRIGRHCYNEYLAQTPLHIRTLDYFLIFAAAEGIILMTYLLLVGSFPYNSFLSAFITAVGFFIFVICLRLQVSYPAAFGGLSSEQAYAEFVICNIILFFVVWTFMG